MNNDSLFYIFDLGNVLVRVHSDRIIGGLCRASGCSACDLVPMFKADRIEDRFERGHMSPREFYEWFVARGFVGDFDTFSGVWCDVFSPIDETAAFFNSLRGKGNVAILSNTNIIHFEYLARTYPFLKDGYLKLLSYEAGLRKPQKEIYEYALSKTGSAPGRTVFIDDRQENIAAAEASGINGILYDSHASITRRLAEICYAGSRGGQHK